MDSSSLSSASRVFLVAAAVIIVLAGVKAASIIIVPLLLAVFISIIMQPVLFWFSSRKLPTWLAITTVFLIISVFGFALTMLIVQSVSEFTASFPTYREGLTHQFDWIVATLAHVNIDVNEEVLQNQLDPSRIMSLMMNMLSGLGGMMTNVFLVILIVVFILGEAAQMPRKLALAFDGAEKNLESLRALLYSINKYLALKTVISLVTGLSIGFGLWVLGIDHFVLWGVLAFLLNYIPNIGSIIAAIPAVLLALVQFHPAMAGAVALLFLVVNVIMGNLVEPKVMGRRLGLSTLVVFLSLIFWGWLLGPVGMLLSVPLTMLVKIALQDNPSTRWIAIMLGGDEMLGSDAEKELKDN
ncbi:AI-2E family transporter [Aliidiomarina celeris]|uniref:AI-2E family transporter n=1 Tax=Aliidiomarina celeris TaxID=2249428 RepID=UPI000DEB90B9|nr:AI-2E family transporter [Aliidiomarina celeris]